MEANRRTFCFEEVQVEILLMTVGKLNDCNKFKFLWNFETQSTLLDSGLNMPVTIIDLNCGVTLMATYSRSSPGMAARLFTLQLNYFHGKTPFRSSLNGFVFFLRSRKYFAESVLKSSMNLASFFIVNKLCLASLCDLYAILA